MNETQNHIKQMTIELIIEWQFSHRIQTETNAEMESRSDLEHCTVHRQQITAHTRTTVQQLIPKEAD